METNDEDITLVVDAGDIEPLEPKSLAEAKRRPEWPEWEKVIYEELKTLEEASTWEISDLPEGANLVGLKWVFHIKKNVTGCVVHSRPGWLHRDSPKWKESTNVIPTHLLRSCHPPEPFLHSQCVLTWNLIRLT